LASFICRIFAAALPLENFMKPSSSSLIVTLLGTLAVAWAALSAPNAGSAGRPPVLSPTELAQYKALFSEKCSACHDLPDPQADNYSRAQWQSTVNRMLDQHHASDSISPVQAAQIVDYLATFAPEPSQNNQKTSDPWATDALDVWTVSPSLTRVYNFQAAHALSAFSPISAGTAGPPAAWSLVQENPTPDGTAAQVRLIKPTPDRFALLMDRTDTAKNLDVQVRFRIVSGKTTPAVGIVFGFSSPKSYAVLVYNQAHQNLSLIQVSGPAHTTLQATPLVLPAAAGQTADAVTPNPINGWHVLRLLVSNGQVRGWLDRTKRISITDMAYQGGKIGLWAQGDTVAAFDDWTIDLYDNPIPSADQPID
jgi:mono/diheme cytochrome c family protein